MIAVCKNIACAYRLVFAEPSWAQVRSFWLASSMEKFIALKTSTSPSSAEQPTFHITDESDSDCLMSEPVVPIFEVAFKDGLWWSIPAEVSQRIYEEYKNNDGAADVVYTWDWGNSRPGSWEPDGEQTSISRYAIDFITWEQRNLDNDRRRSVRLVWVAAERAEPSWTGQRWKRKLWETDGPTVRHAPKAHQTRSVGQPADSSEATRLRRVNDALERIHIQQRWNEKLWVNEEPLLSRDDSLVNVDHGERVYIVDHAAWGFTEPIQEIDYFHGLAQVFDYFPTDFFPTNKRSQQLISR
jgi:hypothetical protein